MMAWGMEYSTEAVANEDGRNVSHRDSFKYYFLRSYRLRECM